ncbi:helix-turn-helix domain-containing protein [Pediococcus damnosus]|uniref:Transcription regulator n=3 Tax=Pediococcus damnosus TaxID=51663 RepID=A0AAC9B325_9LACO|nr:helix-turn-helix transcriptional regulator [Pediococcus damnosus]AMV63354.1 Transcription regulator [Pediococcus damnosus]
MKKIGTTIKYIRKQKKLTQKETYAGIISRTFASNFENGYYNIESEKLFKILQRLGTSINEFGFLHYGENDDKFSYVLSIIDQAATTGDYSQLQKIHQKFENSTSLHDQAISALAYVKIYVHGHNPLSMSLMPTIPLKIHLEQTKEWTFFELRAFVDGIFMFRRDLDSLPLCMERAVKSFKKYRCLYELKSSSEQSIASIFLNYVQIALVSFDYNRDHYSLVNKYPNTQDVDDFSSQLTIQFSKFLQNLYFGNNSEKDFSDSKEFLTMLKKLNFKDYVVFKEIYDYHIPYSKRYRQNHKQQT